MKGLTKEGMAQLDDVLMNLFQISQDYWDRKECLYVGSDQYTRLEIKFTPIGDIAPRNALKQFYRGEDLKAFHELYPWATGLCSAHQIPDPDCQICRMKTL